MTGNKKGTTIWLSKRHNKMLDALSRKTKLPKASILQKLIESLYLLNQGIPHCDFRVLVKREFYTVAIVCMPEVETISGMFKEPINATDEETDRHVREKLLEARGKLK